MVRGGWGLPDMRPTPRTGAQGSLMHSVGWAHRHAVSTLSDSRCRNLLPSTVTWLLLAMGLLSCACTSRSNAVSTSASRARATVMPDGPAADLLSLCRSC